MDQHDWKGAYGGREETKMRLEVQGSYNDGDNW